MFIDFISPQHLCVPRCDCMGVVCTLQLPTGQRLTPLRVGFYLNLESEELEVLYGADLYRVKVEGMLVLYFSCFHKCILL